MCCFTRNSVVQIKITHNGSCERAVTISEVGEKEMTNPHGSYTTDVLACMDLNPPLLRMKSAELEHPWKQNLVLGIVKLLSYFLSKPSWSISLLEHSVILPLQVPPLHLPLCHWRNRALCRDSTSQSVNVERSPSKGKWSFWWSWSHGFHLQEKQWSGPPVC